MKDNRKSRIISNLSSTIFTGVDGGGQNAQLELPTLVYARMNKIEYDFGPIGGVDRPSIILDIASEEQNFTVVKGISGAGGAFVATPTAYLSGSDMYGGTAYTDVTIEDSSKIRVPYTQKSLSLPVGGSNSGVALDRSFLVRKSVAGDKLSGKSELDPHNHTLTYMLKANLHPENAKSIIALGDPVTSAVTFSISFADLNTLEVRHHGNGGSDAVNTHVLGSGNVPKSTWVTIIATAYRNAAGRPVVGSSRVYDLSTGELYSSATINTAANASTLDLERPNLYVGYGEVTGGVNPAFTLTDFVVGADIGEIAVFNKELTTTEMDLVARSSNVKNTYKSGLNNRAPRKMLQLLDAKSSYPESSNPTVVPKATPAFNDTNALDFEIVQNVVYPEMLPVELYSGSQESKILKPGLSSLTARGEEGDTRSFYRDIHNTDLDHRLTGSAIIYPGQYSVETTLLDASTRNSPVTLSKDSSILGGTIAPFDDSNPHISRKDQLAVAAGVDENFDQTIGDHIAIVIDLNPENDTTIGVELGNDGEPFAGRVSSMAYYNFSTKSWQTSGNNNNFEIPGANTVYSSSHATTSVGSEKNDVIISSVISQHEHFFSSASVGFTGTSGFTIFENQGINALTDFKSRGLPTSVYGFPIHKKYEAKDEQLIDMSKYIDSPFLLERVSFEFGAAIEESGPHSLGYRLPFLDAADINSPTMYPCLSASSWSGDQNLTGFDSAAGWGVFMRQGELINGSPIYSLGQDEEYTSVKGSGTPTYANFSTDKSKALNYLISRNGMCTSDGPGPATPLINFYKLHTSSFPNYPGYVVSQSATMMMPTSYGPRSVGVQNRRQYTQQQLQSTFTNRIHALSFIPVLAGGINGIVTGAYSSDSTPDIAGPIVGVNFNDENYNGDYAATNGRRHWLKDAGGVPFWRADSFFLLRQSQKPDDRVDEFSFTISGVASTPMYPLPPYQTSADQAFLFQKGNLSADVPPGKINREKFGSLPYETYLSSTLISDTWKKFLGIQANKKVRMVTSSSCASTREMITFGQMAHYGYANAADSFIDTIWDHRDSYLAHQSGSVWSTQFYNELFSSPDQPIAQSLFPQAIKVASIRDYGYVTIPSNPQPAVDNAGFNPIGAEKTSVFSDYPDTAQGSWSMETDSNSNGLSSWPEIKPSNVGGGGSTLADAIASRNPSGAPYPRYLLSGTQVTANTTYTLDTFIGYPRVADGDVGGNLVDEYSAVKTSSPEYKLLGGTPMGSGMSVITTPSYIAGDSISEAPSASWDVAYNSSTKIESKGIFFERMRFGSFHYAPQDYLAYGLNPSVTAPAIQSDVPREYYQDRPTKSWMDSGLSRDLNIFMSASQTHAGTNLDYADNFCGFTLMTASTAWRPLEQPGRESAALPLVANVYKRQYLNYKKDFKIDVPVRSTVPRSLDTPGYWVTTTPNFITAPPISIPPRSLFYQSAPAGSGADVESMYEKFVKDGKRYHVRNSIVISEGGWVPGTKGNDFPSARRFIRSAVAGEPENTNTQSSLALGGTQYFMSSDEVWNSTATSTISTENFAKVISTGTKEGKFSKEPTVDSLYMLQPSDKLVLGVQPSLPGWNPGSGLPNNRSPYKWGIWDYQKSIAAGYAYETDRDPASGLPVEDNRQNLEDPYQPCHSLKMLAGPSRIVLYGTYVKDGKPYATTSGQKLDSNAIHEAIHYDNPVLDQFLVGSDDDYMGSNLEYHITGSIFADDSRSDYMLKTRGVAASQASGNLLFSGSLQRFVRAIEEKEVYFDTLQQDPFDIAKALGGSTRDQVLLGADAISKYTIVNLNVTKQPHVTSSAEYIDELFPGYTYAFAHGWQDSFPFEQKFSNVRRKTDLSLRFAGDTTAVYRLTAPFQSNDRTTAAYNLFSSVAAGNVNISPYLGYNNTEAAASITGPSNRLPGSKDVYDYTFYDTYDPGQTGSPKYVYEGGIDMTTIGDMANVRQSNYQESSFPSTWALAAGDNSSTDGDAYGKSQNNSKYQRQFFAGLTGWGRENRKQLDFSWWRYFNRTLYIGTGSDGIPWQTDSVRGAANFRHPTGFKYGYMNCDHLSPSAIFRSDRYGQFRDMLEQRMYSKTYYKGDEDRSPGESEAVVSVIFLDGEGNPISDASATSCFNISTALTASKPYIEGDTSRSIIFSSDLITLDPFTVFSVPGFSGAS